ncbi:MAG: hypothetical protein L6V93_18480 [Clostridiales bacterium]|nr:MAG: hypothetical protein L6V93_18480 [Clostridiales bacterium]
MPYLKPVNILMDFEVVSGSVDFDIAALKSNGILKDRSHHDYNEKDGNFKRERQYKGIAQTLPKVCANLNFSVNKSDKDGDFSARHGLQSIQHRRQADRQMGDEFKSAKRQVVARHLRRVGYA